VVSIFDHHNELPDLEEKLLNIVYNDVKVEPTLQEINCEVGLGRINHQTPWILGKTKTHSAFFDIQVCHPNAESYKELTPKQIYRMHENKKRVYNQGVTDIRARIIHAANFHNNSWNRRKV
jgi:hypothetical protein